MIRDRDKGQFRLVAHFKPQGDQPHAMEKLSQGIERHKRNQVLLGVTGSGKTFSMANVVARANRPTLVIAPNKTLAAQLYHEFRSLFPENAVRYFVSYYDYYQPEAYVPSTDTFIEKDASINDEIDKMRHAATSALLERSDVLIVASYPASHYVTPKEVLERALVGIRAELGERLTALRRDAKLLEAQRLEQRTRYDVELLEEMGFCPGIENYSRHLDGREAGEPPYTLLDYFPEDYLLVIDESHVTVPQIGGMYRGDRSRKETLVEFGFRLPSALDNRPLNFEEF